MEKTSKIYVAGDKGMVGSAIVRRLREKGYMNILGRSFESLDLCDQHAVSLFFKQEQPEYVFLAAAKVGGIMANNTYRGQFIYENLMIQSNVIHQSYLHGVKKLLFLGSSCIYPKNAPQPLKEEYLLTGELEFTNEPYAIAKIAGIKLCENYYRQYGCNFLSVMPTNMYGPNDNYNLETSHVLPALIRKMHLGMCLENENWAELTADLDKRPIEGIRGNSGRQEILQMLAKYGIRRDAKNPGTVTVTLWGTGQVFREFMHVDDMAEATVGIMESVGMGDLIPRGSKSPGTGFLNIGTGVDQTISGIATLVKRVIGFRGTILWDAAKPDGTPKKLMDVSKLRSYGFKTFLSLEEGVSKVYRQYIS